MNKELIHCATFMLSVVYWPLSLIIALNERNANSHDYSLPTLLVLLAFVCTTIALLTSERN